EGDRGAAGYVRTPGSERVENGLLSQPIGVDPCVRDIGSGIFLGAMRVGPADRRELTASHQLGRPQAQGVGVARGWVEPAAVPHFDRVEIFEVGRGILPPTSRAGRIPT